MHDLSALESSEQYEDTEFSMRDGEGEDPEVDEAEELESATQLLAVNSEAEFEALYEDEHEYAAEGRDVISIFALHPQFDVRTRSAARSSRFGRP